MAIKQQVEHFDAYGIASSIESGLDLANGAGLGMVVGDEAVEEVRKGGEGDLGSLGAVQVAVVDGFSAGGISQ